MTLKSIAQKLLLCFALFTLTAPTFCLAEAIASDTDVQAVTLQDAEAAVNSDASDTGFLNKHPVLFTLLVLLVIMLVYAYRCTFTPHGRLNYLAAFSLKFLSFQVPMKPVRDMDFKITLPLNFLFALGPVFPKEKIARTRDFELPQEGGDIRVRVYWPESANDQNEPLPVILFMHGGGFVLGDINMWDAITRKLANATSMMVVSVDYRLGPKYPYPAAVDDCYAALTWLSENAENLGADKNRIIVAGDSAGGNLAAVTAMKARDEGQAGIAAQVLYYPHTDWNVDKYPSIEKFLDGYGLSTKAMEGFREAYVGNEADQNDPYLSPMCASSVENLPPALVITAGFDPLTDGALAYADRMEASGVHVTRAHYPDMIHGFLNVPMFSANRDSINKTCDFLKQVIK